ncbi:hypothetical protein FB446DRAFT_795397 [Lentinula raphanica]|nr:hypothetical protein FB446DRAFT_795397 [Lentinula raphanica]
MRNDLNPGKRRSGVVLTLPELRDSMSMTDGEFETFKSLLRNTARELTLDIYELHDGQDEEKWEALVTRMTEESNVRVHRGAVETYFDKWIGYNRVNRRARVIKQAGIRKNSEERDSSNIGLKRSSSIISIETTDSESEAPMPKKSCSEGSDNRVADPGLVGGDAPGRDSRRLHELLERALVDKWAIFQLGIGYDIDLDTIALLPPEEVKELLDLTDLTAYERASFKNQIRKHVRRSDLKQGATVDEVKNHLAEVYGRKEDDKLYAQTISPLLARHFNELHIEHLIPTAIDLGIISDADFEEMKSLKNTAVVERMFGDCRTELSPFKKAVMRWALVGRHD